MNKDAVTGHVKREQVSRDFLKSGSAFHIIDFHRVLRDI